MKVGGVAAIKMKILPRARPGLKVSPKIVMPRIAANIIRSWRRCRRIFLILSGSRQCR